MRCARFILAALLVPPLAAQDIPRVDALSVAQKIGQLLIPSVHPGATGEDTEAWATLRRDLTTHHIGGLHVFRARGEQTASLINRAQGAAKIPVMVTADFEGGTGFIVREGTRFPRGMGLAATGDPDLADRVARIVGAEGRRVGVHVNFFPVMDVNNNPDNPIINLRSFGDRPGDVARFGAAYVRGLQSKGMLGTAKHFPGHGDTSSDSHLELPVVMSDRARLDKIELPPFRAAIDAGVACVMSAHIAWPEVTGNKLPATLAPSILTGLLRDEMKFQGVCFTDALVMKGITRLYSPEEASLRAVLAGADALLFTQDVPRVANALMKAVEEGRLPTSRLDEACGRILAAKRRLGPGIATPATSLGVGPERSTATRVQTEAITRSMTLLRRRAGRFPIKDDAEASILHVAITDPGQPWTWDDPLPGVEERLDACDGKVTYARLPDDVTVAANLDIVRARAEQSDVVIVTAVAGLAAYRGKTGLSDAQSRAVRLLASDKAVLVLLGNPYGFPVPDGYGSVLVGYDYDRAHGRYAMKAVLGDYSPTGRLPVDVPGLGKRGDGLNKPR